MTESKRTMQNSSLTDDEASFPLHDSMAFLHELRTRELRRMPQNAAVVLSAGCSSPYYFRWFADNYSSVRRHIGVEAYLAKPANLPANAEWIASSVSNMKPVPDGSADLVFAGQVIEHLWPEEVTGFLCEARRVLRHSGYLVMDSPNRRVTEALNWIMPEHTVEFTVDEMVDLLQLAGFENLQVKGIWLCYAREQHRFLPLSPTEQIGDWAWRRRIEHSATRPEDCFVWWIEAISGNLPIDRAQIEQSAWSIFKRFQSLRQQQLFFTTGKISTTKHHKLITTSIGESGYMIYGPYIPLPAGTYRATFAIRCDSAIQASQEAETIACTLDCHESSTQKVLSSYQVKASELPAHRFASFSLSLRLDRPAFGVEFRIHTAGILPLTARLSVSIEEE